MRVRLVSKPIYHCTCDKCGATEKVEKTESIYNAASAVRSLGWSFGKDKSVACKKCRMQNWGDNYKWFSR